MEKHINLVRGKETLTSDWQVGYLKTIIPIKNDLGHLDIGEEEIYLVNDSGSIKIDPKTLCYPTGKNDINSQPLYSNDCIVNLDGTKMQICYGEHQMWCPVDNVYMDNIGFYVISDKHPHYHMPLGPTEDYAIKVNNIYD